MATKAYLGVHFYDLNLLVGVQKVWALTSRPEHPAMSYQEFTDETETILESCVEMKYHFVEPEDATPSN